LYDRSGLGFSEASSPDTGSRNAISIAAELDQLLDTIDLKPPYVLLCHSYGGILSREFVHVRQSHSGHENDVVGWVFVDAAQERSVEWWPNLDLDAISAGVDPYAARGIKEESVLTEKEWQSWIDLEKSGKHQRTSAAELEHYVASGRELGKKLQLEKNPPLLGDRPISVIRGDMVRDCVRIYEAGVIAGNGTSEERDRGKKWLDRWPEEDDSNQKAIMKLSTNSRFVRALKSGHLVHFTEPDVIAAEVKWVLDNLEAN
jgi:pimeloyl-ACP methyl ester carboxylesterase